MSDTPRPKPHYPGMRARHGRCSITRHAAKHSDVTIEVVDDKGKVVCVVVVAEAEVGRMLLGSMTVPCVISDFGDRE